MNRALNVKLLSTMGIALAASAIIAPQDAHAEGCSLLGGGATVSQFPTPIVITEVYDTTNLVCGVDARAGNNGLQNATAVGGRSSAVQDATAVGYNARADGTNSVAIGSGSVATLANTFSVGAVGNERQIVNVAAGTSGTHAVNLNQLNAVSAVANAANSNAATALTAANNAQATANTALTNSATALTTANTALATANTAQTNVNALQTVVSSVQTTVSQQGTAISQMQALDAQQNSSITALQAAQSSLSTMLSVNSREANGGIASAMAMGGTILPADANFAVSFNLATYRGEQGFAGTAVIKAGSKVYINAGFAGSTVKGSTGARAGVTFAW